MNDTERKTKKKKKHIGRLILFIILLLLIIFGIWFAKRIYDMSGNWIAVLLGHNQQTVQNLDKLQFLILGESTGMSDTIIVCSYDPKTQKASMLSIPRDTFIGTDKKNTHTTDKINSLYTHGETPEKTIAAVNKITGLNLQYYIIVDTEALRELVDDIGGVEFEVPIDMDYDDGEQNLHIHLKQGLQTLNGEQSEGLVRFRHNSDGSSYSYSYGDNDFGRMKTQRNFIISLAKQTAKFKNVTEIGNIVDIFKKYVKTNLDWNKLKDYIPYAINMDMDSIQTAQLPGVADYLGILSFFLYDEDETKEIVDQLFNDVAETVEDGNNVVNATE